MKSNPIIYALLIALFAGPVSARELTVQVDTAGAGGNLHVGLFNTAATFPEGTPLVGVISQASGPVTVLHLANIPVTRASVAVFLDLDGNGKLTRDSFGLPNEPYGFSGSGSFFGAPSFKDASVDLRRTSTLRIKLHK